MIRRSAPILISCLVALVYLTGCGSSSPTPPKPPTASVSYSPATAAPPANSVSLVNSSTAGSSSITLSVQANSLANAFGVHFDLVWNSGIVRYVSSSEGTFMSSDGSSVSFLAQQQQSGGNTDPDRLVVGITRLGPVGGVTGSGELMRVTFSTVATGSTGVSFEASAVDDPSGAPIAAVTFHGGTVNVQR